MSECLSNYKVRVFGRVRQMEALLEFKILCPMRSVAKFVPLVPISSSRGTPYDQVVFAIRFF